VDQLGRLDHSVDWGGERQVLLGIEGLVGLGAMHDQLGNHIAKADAEIKGLSARLASPNFAGKTPPEVVAQFRVHSGGGSPEAAGPEATGRSGPMSCTAKLGLAQIQRRFRKYMSSSTPVDTITAQTTK
jgi:hypothetical protein